MAGIRRRSSLIGSLVGMIHGLTFGLVLSSLITCLYMRSGSDHGSYWGAWGISHPVFRDLSALLVVLPVIVAARIGYLQYKRLHKLLLAMSFGACVVVMPIIGSQVTYKMHLEFPPRIRESNRFYSVTIPAEKY